MNYRMTIVTVTPLHIGSGSILLRDWDYVTGDKNTFVLDRDAVLTAEFERTRQVPLKPPGRLIAREELREDSAYVRYALAGTMTVDQVREQIKDVHGRLYLPGSSLKGALRTVLFSHALENNAFAPDLKRLKGESSWAAQPWEREAFGQDPNHDLMRAVRVSDSQPLSATPKRLALVQAQVFQEGKGASPIWVEALAPTIPFETRLQLDEFLLKSDQAAALGWGEKGEWLRRLPELAQARANSRIAEERRFAEQNKWGQVVSALDKLAKFQPKENEFLIQLGWGTGYGGITIGKQLGAADQLQVRRRYRLGRAPRAGGDWVVNDAQPFPKSRRLRVASGRNADAVPDYPLGWVRVILTREK